MPASSRHVGNHHTMIYPCAGEAHWQNGFIERHIQTHKRTHQKLMLEERFSSLNTQEVVDAASTAKNMQGVYNGYSPIQWLTGNQFRHPFLDSQFVKPVDSTGDVEDPFVSHLMRRQGYPTCSKI